jgi:sulfite oxidase
MLAWEMNDEPIPAAHGFPLRVIVPGHVGVRNVKWVNKIVLSKEEAPGPWQRGMAYKGFPPSLKTLDGVDTEKIPSLQEQPVQSSILMPTQLIAGQTNVVSGYAYSGGGRGIVRVDVSIDNGQTWIQATLGEGSHQDLNKSWAWTFWECDVLVPDTKSQLTVICKATDASYNVQPDSVAGIWYVFFIFILYLILFAIIVIL